MEMLRFGGLRSAGHFGAERNLAEPLMCCHLEQSEGCFAPEACAQQDNSCEKAIPSPFRCCPLQPVIDRSTQAFVREHYREDHIRLTRIQRTQGGEEMTRGLVQVTGG
jgi:hypothetical protein